MLAEVRFVVLVLFYLSSFVSRLHPILVFVFNAFFTFSGKHFSPDEYILQTFLSGVSYVLVTLKESLHSLGILSTMHFVLNVVLFFFKQINAFMVFIVYLFFHIQLFGVPCVPEVSFLYLCYIIWWNG